MVQEINDYKDFRYNIDLPPLPRPDIFHEEN